MLKIVMEDMPAGEIAAMYCEGEDAIILVSRNGPDDERCAAINKLLGRLAVQPPPVTALRLIHGGAVKVTGSGSVAALGGFLTHLSEQVTSPAGQGLQTLVV